MSGESLPESKPIKDKKTKYMISIQFVKTCINNMVGPIPEGLIYQTTNRPKFKFYGTKLSVANYRGSKSLF